jgi:hypothetical protein
MPIMFVDVSDDVFYTLNGLAILFDTNLATTTDQFLRRALALPDAQIADAMIIRLKELAITADPCPYCSCHTAKECRERTKLHAPVSA